MTTALLCGAFTAFAGNIDTANTEIRPGGEGRPFWNAYAQQFLYPPAFDFAKNDGAAEYRFRLKDAKGTEYTFSAERPDAPMTPIWAEVAVGPASVVCEALDAEGKTIGVVGERSFRRLAPFTGDYPKAPRSYGESARMAVKWAMSQPFFTAWKTNVIDITWQLACYPSKTVRAVIDISLKSAEYEPSTADDAFGIAKNAADWIIATSVKAPSPMAGFPLTYYDTYEATKHLGDSWDSKLIAHKKRDEVMLVYPCAVATSMLELGDRTGERKYIDYATAIADTYLRLQSERGTWPLLMRISDGGAVGANTALPVGICSFLEKMYKRTGDVRYHDAADRAVPEMLARIKSFDWEGQFEDTVPQKERYRNPSKHTAIDTMFYLLKRYPDDKSLVKDALDVARFVEDQFVEWSDPHNANYVTPCALEQYNCYLPIDASCSKVAKYFLKIAQVTGDKSYLVKAQALGDTIVRCQFEDGCIPTTFFKVVDKSRLSRIWYGCIYADILALEELSRAYGF